MTSKEAAAYLGVSGSILSRDVKAGSIVASSQMGRNHLFSEKAVKAFKRSLKAVKRV